MRIFKFLEKAKTFKDTITGAIDGLKMVFEMKDRADDDLDGNGKAEYVDILDELQEQEDRAERLFKKVVDEVKVLAGDVIKTLHRAQRLAAHVQTPEPTAKEAVE